MMTFLEFTFRSFWHWAGVTLLIIAVLNGIREIVEVIRRKW